MLTIAPAPSVRISGMAYLAISIIDVTLIRSAWSQAAMSTSTASPGGVTRPSATTGRDRLFSPKSRHFTLPPTMLTSSPTASDTSACEGSSIISMRDVAATAQCSGISTTTIPDQSPVTDTAPDQATGKASSAAGTSGLMDVASATGEFGVRFIAPPQARTTQDLLPRVATTTTVSLATATEAVAPSPSATTLGNTTTEQSQLLSSSDTSRDPVQESTSTETVSVSSGAVISIVIPRP